VSHNSLCICYSTVVSHRSLCICYSTAVSYSSLCICYSTASHNSCIHTSVSHSSLCICYSTVVSHGSLCICARYSAAESHNTWCTRYSSAVSHSSLCISYISGVGNHPSRKIPRSAYVISLCTMLQPSCVVIAWPARTLPSQCTAHSHFQPLSVIHGTTSSVENATATPKCSWGPSHPSGTVAPSAFVFVWYCILCVVYSRSHPVSIR
jgi:hypothetical protein